MAVAKDMKIRETQGKKYYIFLPNGTYQEVQNVKPFTMFDVEFFLYEGQMREAITGKPIFSRRKDKIKTAKQAIEVFREWEREGDSQQENRVYDVLYESIAYAVYVSDRISPFLTKEEAILVPAIQRYKPFLAEKHQTNSSTYQKTLNEYELKILAYIRAYDRAQRLSQMQEND